MIIVVAGNEGAGKTTLAKRLRKDQFKVKDPGPIEIQASSEEEVFLILDVPVEVARERLKAAGRNLNQPMYALDVMTRYREHCLEMAQRLPHCRLIDASTDQACLHAIAINSISQLAVERHRTHLSRT